LSNHIYSLFVFSLKDADHWIYPSDGFSSAEADFPELQQFVSVQSKQVFDYLGQGPNAWFEQRLAEPDVILQDFCAVVGTINLEAPVPHERAWFRNVYSEAVGSLGQCTDPEAPLVTKGTNCIQVPALQKGSDSSAEALKLHLMVALVVMGAFVVG
jgi:hypothetical protein